MDNYRQHIWPFFEVGKLPSGEKRQEPGVHFDLTIEGRGGKTGTSEYISLLWMEKNGTLGSVVL